MNGKGCIYLYDSRGQKMEMARKRLKRASLYNVSFVSDLTDIEDMIGKFNWIVLDVPCSGTGTLRRNPDLKLKFNKNLLNYYVEL
jgi:16S rRNA C967 or C1407 C5-methylase (RsmB/RsmF family)